METVTIKIKKLSNDAIIPQYQTNGAAAMDLTATAVNKDKDGTHVYDYSTGIALEIPKGYVGLIFPRSSIYKQDLSLTNCVGVIDSDYRGEIKVKHRLLVQNINSNKSPKIYKPGDRIAQIMFIPIPNIKFEEVYELSQTTRDVGGFGSTDKK